MSRHVQFRHHADAACGGVADQSVQLFPGVVGVTVRQFRMGGSREPETLVVAQVQVQDVELVELHHVQSAL